MLIKAKGKGNIASLNKGRAEEKALGLGGPSLIYDPLETFGERALGLSCSQINHHTWCSWLVISL